MRIEIGPLKFTTPDTWNQMSQEQAVLCAKIYMGYQHGCSTLKTAAEVMDLKRQTAAFMMPVMLGVSPKKWINIMNMIGIEQAALMVPITDVIFGDTARNKHLQTALKAAANHIERENIRLSFERKLILTKNHLPQIMPSLKSSAKYFGPSDRLMNVTIEEFNHADALFMKHWEHPDEDYLDGLISVLWRPGDQAMLLERGDAREPFNKFNYIDRAKAFKDLPDGFKALIFLWYKGCRTYIERSHPHVFPRGEGSEASGPARHAGWSKVIAEMAGGKFGDFEKTRRTPLWDFLGVLEAELSKAEAAKNKHRTHAHA